MNEKIHSCNNIEGMLPTRYSYPSTSGKMLPVLVLITVVILSTVRIICLMNRFPCVTNQRKL